MKEKRFFGLVKEAYKTPFEVVSDELFQMSREKPGVFISKYLNEKELGKKLYNEINIILDSSESLDKNIFKTSIAHAMGLHPGIDTIMRDKDLLRRALSVAEEKEKGSTKDFKLTEAVESQNSGILQRYQKQRRDEKA